MPNLKHLLEELEELGIEPKRIRIPGQLYDNMVADAEDSGEDEEEEGTNAYRVTEAAINAMKNTVQRADSDTPPAKVSKQQGQKIEERLESLARMY